MNSPRLTKLMYWGGMVIQLLVIWTLGIYVTQDGPSHLYNAQLFNSLLGNPDKYALFELNLALFPNWSGSILLASLLHVFEPVIAEKVWVSLLVFGFVHSGYLLVRQINPAAGYLGLVCLYLGQNFFLIYGFHNFVLSLIIFNVVILYYLRHHAKPSAWYFPVLSLLLILMFFTHPVALIFVLLYLGIEVLINVLQKTGSAQKVRELLLYSLTVLPAIVMFLIYFLQGGSESDTDVLVFNLSANSIAKLLSLYYLNAFGTFEFILNVLVGILLFGGLVYFVRRLITLEYLRRFAGFIGVLVFCIFMYFFMSDAFAGGTFLTRRITLNIYILVLCLLAGLNLRPRLTTVQGGVLLVLFLALTIYRYPKQREISAIVGEYLEASAAIQPGTVLVQIETSRKGVSEDRDICAKVGIFSHISDYLAIKSGALTMDNYEANTAYFPIKWKEGVNPYGYINAEEASDRWNFSYFQLGKFTEVSRVQVSRLILFGQPAEKLKDSEVFREAVEVYDFELLFSNSVVQVYGASDTKYSE